MRRVISSSGMDNFECTDADHDAEPASSSSARSSVPSDEDVHLHAREQPEGGEPSLRRAISSSCAPSRSWAEAVGDREAGEWSVITRYSWPSAIAARAIDSSEAPPSDHVVRAAVTLEQLVHGAADAGIDARRGLELGEVGRRASEHRGGDHRAG